MNHKKTLSAKQVWDMRVDYHQHNMTQQAIAEKYGMKQNNISPIITGKHFANVPMPQQLRKAESGTHKFTKATEMRLAKLVISGHYTQRYLCERFCISPTTMRGIMQRCRSKHLLLTFTLTDNSTVQIVALSGTEIGLPRSARTLAIKAF